MYMKSSFERTQPDSLVTHVNCNCELLIVCTKGHQLHCLRHVLYYPSNLGRDSARALVLVCTIHQIPIIVSIAVTNIRDSLWVLGNTISSYYP